MALVEKKAACLVADKDANETLVDEAMKLLFDEQRARVLSENMAEAGETKRKREIVNEIEKLIGANKN